MRVRVPGIGSHCMPWVSRAALLLGLSVCATGRAWAQDGADDDDDASTTKNFRWTPYGAPGYSPELGGLISTGALFSFSLDPEDPELPRSSIPVSASFTTSGSVIFAVTPSFYLRGDKIRIFGTLLAKNLNDNFWGVGYDAGVSPSAPDETTKYQRVWWQIAPRVVFQVAKDLFVGPVLDLNQTIASDMPPEMAE
jgi:hypothetical protein